MEQVQNPMTTKLETNELPFELAPEIKCYFENELNRTGNQNSVRECKIIFPDRFVDSQSLLSFVMFSRADKHYWEISDISIHQIINQGQSTEFVGKIDGESDEFDVIEIGYCRDELISRWQERLVKDIKYDLIFDEKNFTPQYLKLLRSTGHEVVFDFEEQKPELCETQSKNHTLKHC